MADTPARPSRKGKEKDAATDFQDRMIAFQRKHHAPYVPRSTCSSQILIPSPPTSITRPRDRPERTTLAPISTQVPAGRSPPTASPPRKPTPQQAPHVVVSSANDAPNADDFSRRLHISSSPRQHTARAQGKTLFNPNTDPIPMRRTQEPDAMSESTGSSYARAPAQRQLFDHKRDDPVRFNARSKPPVPTPRSSGDYISSASSYYTPSIASSSFTLSSSTTEGSSDPSSIFDSNRAEPKPSNVFTVQLKKLYRDITSLETKIMRDELDESGEEGRVLLRGAPTEDAESARWQKTIQDHKTFAEMMRQLLGISTAPSVPTSLRNIPEKYNIIVRLWTYGFHKLLENLRRSSLHSIVALEHLQSFIYFAYTFYASLYEEVNLSAFRAGWLEALGDLARYRMAVAAMLPQPAYASSYLTATNASGSGGLTPYPILTPTSTMGNASDNSDMPLARIDDSPSPSVGIVAARNFELEPEKERWRAMAREWYGAGVADTPGAGKLHHHLGLLSREAEGEELRGIYHFTKSMIATHPFSTSRESVLPIWSQAAQARRMQADASAADLFVLLHGMLFTNIQLDDFAAVQGRLLERLAIDAPERREWMMMACVNIAAILEYGRPNGLLRRVGALPMAERTAAAAAVKVKLARKEREGEGMDVDGAPSPALSEASAESCAPLAFTKALELAFAMLTHTAERASRRGAPSAYASVLLTFLATTLKHPGAFAALERAVPWSTLAALLAQAPSRVLRHEGGTSEKLTKRPALPEDWCVRGMAWPGRTLFEKGFWKTDDVVVGKEIEVLNERDPAPMDIDPGKLEDDSDGETGEKIDDDTLRWTRIVWAGARIARCVDGFVWEGGRAWAVRGALAEKVARWEAEKREAREEEARRRSSRRWEDGDEAMDVDEEAAVESESEDDEADSPEVRELKARRRYLRSLLQPSTPQPAPTPRRTKRPAPAPTVRLAPGYTVLVLDTNILLASLPAVQSLIESNRWTIVVPLPVIMELDGLSSAGSALASQARAAVELLITRVRTHSIALKVQTSRGNYLSSLSVRREAVDFDSNEPGAWERSMDDLILRAAVWQAEHWADRSAVLCADGERGRERDTRGASTVVLCSLDRNLRVKARGRGVDAAGERELADLLA
ncbi:hypothetical protein K488DRAFT_35566, partial [Vararia minispora EC-137]